MKAVGKAKTIRRDSFARGDVIRKIVPCESDGCAWCGSIHKRLFRYGWKSDSLRGEEAWDDQSFCCKGCRDSYYS